MFIAMDILISGETKASFNYLVEHGFVHFEHGSFGSWTISN